MSPKKTLEGAAVGLSASVAVAVLLARLLQWPTSIPRYYLSAQWDILWGVGVL